MSAAGTPPVIPVILCGGSGTRLWPLSSADRPKQFLPLIGPRSTFQATVRRVQAIAGAGPILVVANQDHRALIENQLAEIGARALLLLEPCARDSGPAIAAASVWIEAGFPGAVAVFVSADHHIVDDAAFGDAIGTAVGAALQGRIVTLGLKPTHPATAFGYIRPQTADDGVQPVAAFVEKPDLETARTYVAAGYLWNSGNFISRPAVLLEDLAEHAPALKAAAEAAVAGQTTVGEITLLGEAFASAPTISIDHALMERTRRASVMPVSFTWSDIGAWDAVLDAAEQDADGNSLTPGALAIDSQGSIVRAPPGTRVALIGVSGLAVIVGEDGTLLVCDLKHSQAMKLAAVGWRTRG